MNDEIKMFIAGEEVVSQNEFTINEEMLSASSTILNNCYPKSWELTKDYISNFYYPKDYSRFVIGQGEYLHGNDEFAPLEITGTNLFDGVWELGIYNGTTGAKVNTSSQMRCANFIPVKELTNYKFSIDNAGITAMYVYEYKEDYTYNLTTNKVIYLDNYLTTNKNTKYITFRPNSNIVDLQAKAQLQEGTQATIYEPYNQPNLTYETNVEKEWNSFNIYGNTYQETRSGKNLLNPNILEAGNIDTSTGENSYGNARITNDYIKVTPNQVYSFQYKTTSANKQIVVYEYSSSKSYIKYDVINNLSGSVVLSSTTEYIRLRFSGDYSVQSSDIYEVQVELGNSPTEYQPFGEMPSPDYPSELVSVGYENILEPNFESTSGGGITISITDKGWLANGTPTSNASFYIFNGTLPKGTYTINGIAGSANNTYQLVIYKAGTIVKYLTTDNYTFTLTEETAMALRLYFYTNYGRFDNMLFPYQLEKGSQTHSYIPYGKYGIEVKTNGKNLFDKNAITPNTSINNANGNTYNDTNSFSTDFIDITEIDNLVWNGKSGSTQTWGAFYNYDKSYNSKILTTSRTIAVPSTVKYIRLGIKNEYLNTLQIEKGTQATTYEEYKSNSQLYVLDEPLRQIGTYKDKLYTDGRVLYVEREVGNVVLNGSEEWENQWNTSTVKGYRVSISDIVISTNLSTKLGLFSNYYAEYTQNDLASGTTHYGICGRLNNSQIIIRNDDMTSTNGFKSWLSTHNTEVNYILATPTITPLGYIDLPISYEGQNNVSIYTGLDTRTELWYYWKNYDVLFAGVVKNSGDISLNPRHPHYCSLQILDYKTFLSESNTLDFVIANKTISEAISMVVNAVSGYGFIVGNIDIDSANDVIGAYSTLNKSAYDVLQYLAEISGSRWRARVVDSLTMAIDFYDPDTLPQAEDIEYTQEYWENNNIVDLTFNYGTRDYRNKQILLSDEVYANINYDETLISNGYSNTFTLQNNIGDVVSVVVDGAEKTIGTNNDKQMGVEADFYFTPGKNVVESNSIYSAGTMIHLTYQPLVKGRQIVYNNSEVDRISQQTQTDGVIARYETRNDVLSSDELEKIAKTYIEYKGKAEVILTLRTQNKDLYNIGEVVYFNAPISDLAQNYMVKSKKIEYVVINKIVNLFYIYELTSSFNSEKAINYFDNQRSKATGNIEEGESITRNVDIETQANIIWSDGSVSSATVTVTGDNVLNCALNSPFVE